MAEIFINQDWSLRRDAFQWIITKYGNHAKDRDGNLKFNDDGSPMRVGREAYFTRLEHAIVHLINVEAGDCESLDELRDLLANAVVKLTAHVERQVNEEMA